MSKLFDVAYFREGENPSNLRHGFLTDEDLAKEIDEKQNVATSDITDDPGAVKTSTTPQFRTSLDKDDIGEYNEKVKEDMEKKRGGITTTNKGEDISVDCECDGQLWDSRRLM